ncbi:HAD family phosphatase [Streptomyces sp. ICN988]|uniref:HAD family hydrolase n=1 Tax=Streptomyces sp. ICN988 TaxID=2983765 RepID=UPI0021E43DF0|nr:HAD family phosphatase [Streptomyces sp. ICN988]MCV2464433.1 HAD family phosphatase [Streptomyces sp. ICN988]
MTASTPTTAHPELDAAILDYNGVIGLQPTTDQWLRLARTALWPEDDLPAFQHAFWNARPAYDAGQLSDLAYWATVLGHHPGARRLRELREADTDMWTSTDDRVVEVLEHTHASGLPLVLLSNAPRHLSNVLDRHPWRRLMTHALYSARLQVCKPDPAAYQHALNATGAAGPDRVLFVDDRADNCHAARRLGLRTLHYTGRSTDLAAALHPAN